jgi:hypothetical protein
MQSRDARWREDKSDVRSWPRTVEIVDGSWLAMDGAFRPEPPPAPALAPGAPDDEEMHAAWEAWSQSSDRATELRAALQGAIHAGENSEIARLKQEVGAAGNYLCRQSERPGAATESPSRKPRLIYLGRRYRYDF